MNTTVPSADQLLSKASEAQKVWLKDFIERWHVAAAGRSIHKIQKLQGLQVEYEKWLSDNELASKDETPAPWLNSYQVSILNNYECGDFSWLLLEPNEAAYIDAVSNCGDGLLKFMLAELSTKEGVESAEEAYRRLEMAQRQLSETLENMMDDMASVRYKMAG